MTRDQDLFDLKDDRIFRQVCRGTRIVDPLEFLQEVAVWDDTEPH